MSTTVPDAKAGQFDIERDGRCTTIKLRGIWKKHTAENLGEELRASLATAPTPCIAYDMRGLKGFEVLARSVMVSIHEELCKSARCVFITDRSRFRGLALWILRLSQDTHATVVRTRGQADAWLLDGPGARQDLGAGERDPTLQE